MWSKSTTHKIVSSIALAGYRSSASLGSFPGLLIINKIFWRKKNKTVTCKHHGKCVLFMLSKSASNRFSFNLNPDWELAGLASAGQKSGAPVQQQPTRISQLHNTASLASLGTRLGQWLKFHPLFYLLALTFISSILAGKDTKVPKGIALLLPTTVVLGTRSVLNKAY